MLQELVPIQRHLVTMDMLPDRPKWTEEENVLKLEHNRTFVARDSETLKQVIGVVSGDKMVYFQVDSLPSFPLLTTEEQPTEFLVSDPEWTATSQKVDMHTVVSLDFVDTRYIETILASPVEMFVKSTLARARPNPGSLEKFRSLVVPPEALARAHATKIFPSPAMQEAMDAWRLQQPQEPQELLKQQEFALKQKETQLQVILLLEIFSRDPSIEQLLDAHFDRLLLFQALSQTTSDSVLEFCQNVLWTFYRHTLCRLKVTQLILRAKGKPQSKSAEAALASTPTISLRSASRSASLLERARSLRFEKKKVDGVPAKPQATIPDSFKPNKREVEVSFKSASVSKLSRSSTLQSQARQQRQSSSRSRHEPPRKRVKPVHVYATPVANRIKELPMEDIEQPNLEVESTDEDE